MNLLKINLEKQLAKQGKQNEKDYQYIIDEANKLLQLQVEDDKAILARFGFDKNIQEAKKIQRDNRCRNNVLSKLDKKRIFTEDQIKSLCVKYGLRFLDAKKYKGQVDPLLPAKIREFETMWNNLFYRIEKRVVGKKTISRFEQRRRQNPHNGFYNEFASVEIKDQVDDERWFLNDTEWKANYNNYRSEEGPAPYPHDYKICAPAESFKLEERPKDPLMFAKVYETHDGIKYYYLIHKWGNDLNIERYIVNLHKRNKWSWFMCMSIYVSIATFTANSMDTFAMKIIFGVIAVILFVIWAIVAIASSDTDTFNDQLWISEFKD